MSLADLPPLREVLADHGLMANKAFGQHFLLDLHTIVEIGPGPGGLTRALLEAGALVTAVEKDPRFIPLLNDLGEAADGRLTVVEGDALKVDETALAAGAPAKVISNLPYNVGTPLLIKWLTGPFRPLSMTLMFQKEVAERIVASAGSDAYGRLAVIAQATATAEIVMDLPARAFTPPPKVASAVVNVVPLPAPPEPALLKALEKVTAAAFGQRRKLLRSSLKALGGEALCQKAGLDANVRAEVVPVEGFLRLAAAVGT